MYMYIMSSSWDKEKDLEETFLQNILLYHFLKIQLYEQNLEFIFQEKKANKL